MTKSMSAEVATHFEDIEKGIGGEADMVSAWRSFFSHSCGAVGCDPLVVHPFVETWGTKSCKLDCSCILLCPRRRHGDAWLGCKIRQLGVSGCQDARRVVETPSVLHDARTPRQPYWRDRSTFCCQSVALCITLTPRPDRQQHRRSWRKVPGRVSGQPRCEAKFGKKLHQPQWC